MYYVDQSYCIDLGRSGESLARTLEIDVSAWLETWPDAAFVVRMLRNTDSEAYPISISYDSSGSVLLVPITSTETEIPGAGQLQISAYENNVIVKSAVWPCYVTASIDASSGSSAGQTWVDAVIQAGANAVLYAGQAADSAQDAADTLEEAEDTIEAAGAAAVAAVAAQQETSIDAVEDQEADSIAAVQAVMGTIPADYSTLDATVDALKTEFAITYADGTPHAYNAGTRRNFWPDVIPAGATITNVVIPLGTATGSLTLEVWDLGVDEETLTRTFSRTFTSFTPNADNTFQVNSWSANKRMLCYYVSSVQTYYRKEMTGYTFRYISDVSTTTASLNTSELSTFTGFSLPGTINYTLPKDLARNRDFFTAWHNGNLVVFGDSTVDGSSTTDYHANTTPDNAPQTGFSVRADSDAPNVFSVRLQNMIRTFTGNSDFKVFNAGYAGNRLRYICKNYSAIMANFTNVTGALIFLDVNSAQTDGTGNIANYKMFIGTYLPNLIRALWADGIAVAVVSPQPMYYSAANGTVPAINSAGEFAIAVNIAKDVCRKFDVPFINIAETTNKVMLSPHISFDTYYGDSLHFGDGGHKLEAFELYGELVHPVVMFDGGTQFIGLQSNRGELGSPTGISSSLVNGYQSVVLSANHGRSDVLHRFYVISTVPFTMEGIPGGSWGAALNYNVFLDGSETPYVSNTIEAGATIPAGFYEVTVKPRNTTGVTRYSGLILRESTT